MMVLGILAVLISCFGVSFSILVFKEYIQILIQGVSTPETHIIFGLFLVACAVSINNIYFFHNEFLKNKTKYIIVECNFGGFETTILDSYYDLCKELGGYSVNTDDLHKDLQEVNIVMLKNNTYVRQVEINEFKVRLFLDYNLIPKQFHIE